MTSEVVAPRSRLNAVASWCALILAIAYFSARGGPIFSSGVRLWDYAVYASSSYEWAQGRDPYDHEAVDISWRIRGPGYGLETSLARWQTIAPPWTLAVLSPFATLPLVFGSYLYLVVTFGLNVLAAARMARWAGLIHATSLRWFASALLVSVPMKLGLASGNPVVLAAPLLLLGLYESWRGRTLLGGVLLGLGTAYKMQLGVPLLIFWAIYRRWKSASIAAIVFAIIAAIGIVRPQLASVDAWHGWLTNVAAANGPGGVNDFATTSNPDDHLNLQVPLWWLLHNRTIANGGAAVMWSLPAAAFAWWLFMRRGERDAMTTLLAVGVAITLTVLPIYHRAYDGLMFFPIVALAVAMVGRRAQIGWLLLALLAPMVIPSGLPGMLERRGFLPSSLTSLSVYRGLLVPLKAWATFALCIELLAILLSRSSRDPSDMPEKSTRG